MTDGGKGQRKVFNRRFTDEHKRRISESRKGIKFSEEHKLKLKEAKLNNPTKFWKGKKFSEEHKQNLRKPKIRKNAK